MGKQVRIHTLAKELNVSSKDILEKCRAEGIELNNHMAAISLGLAESIREWFSDRADVTSVEAAAPVDLAKVKKPRASRSKAKAATDEGAAATAVAEAPPAESAAIKVAEIEPPPVSLPKVELAPPAEPPAPSITAEAAPEVAPEAAPAKEAAPISAPESPPAPEPEQPATVALPSEPPAPAPAVAPPRTPPAPPNELRPAARATPSQPKPGAAKPPAPTPPVGPVGPTLVPKPAELRGPRIVRIEAPEPVSAPRPRPGGGPLGGPRGPMAPSIEPPPGDAGIRGRSRRPRDDESEKAARAKTGRKIDATQEAVERIREWRDQDLAERQERLAQATGHGLRDRRAAERRRQAAASSGPHGPVAKKTEIEISIPITVKEFCAATGVNFAALNNKLMEHTGRLFTINQSLDAETAELAALDFGLTLKVTRPKSALERIEEQFAARERANPRRRPPVVTILGHVDHGKTSLLDRIRSAKVAQGEAGGITQRIGAYRVTHDGWDVTFLDTPGHAAFTAMRARGANLTDVVVLVVSAIDGVMPQTVEAINHAKAAGVPIVVALNKIDIPGADINRVYAQLSEHELVPSEWGGNTDVIKTSAVTGQGVDDLVAHLSTLSDLLDLKADPDVPATATVIESHLKGGRGNVAQVLVREGTLKVGQTFVCGPASGRIRSLLNDTGKRVREAGPCTPVEVDGLDELPSPGDRLFVVDDPTLAKEAAEDARKQRREESLVATRKPATLEDLLRTGAEGETPELNIIVKAVGQASVDALRHELAKVPSEKARLRILHAGVGVITEADVTLAHASKAVIFGYDVIAEDRARQLADQLGVEIRLYRVIYEVVGDVIKAMQGLLEPDLRYEVRGRVEVRKIFNVSRVGTVAGCVVTDGVIQRSHKVRLIRDGRIVQEKLALDSLKRFKDDVREVRAGLECGIKLDGYDDVKPGDVLEAIEVIEVVPEL